MKRLALTLVTVLLASSLYGCSKPSDSGESKATPTPSASTSVETTTSENTTSETTGGNFASELTVQFGAQPDTMDPALNSAADASSIILHMFEGLTTMDSNATPVPGQAEKWDVSADGLVYTFTLRDGLKWSDGQPLTSKDFLYAWNRAIDPETAADYEYMYDVIKGYSEGQLAISAPDDKTFVVELIAPTPYFLELISNGVFYPVRQDIVEANGEKWATQVSTYVGNGAYTMTEWVESSYIMAAKNPNYWNAGAVATEKIRFLLMDDDNAVLAAFQNGEAAFVETMPNDEIDAWRDKPEFNLEGQLGTYYISYNAAKAPLDNPKVRKALTLAIDREFITKQIGKAGQVPAGAFVPIGLTDADSTKEFRAVGEYYDASAAGYEANVEEAKKLLAEAGYPNGEGFPNIEYLFNVGTGHQAIAEALQNMWKTNLGINVSLSSQEWATFLNTRKNGEYFIARNGWLGDYNDPITFLDMWVTGGGNNDAQWSNAEYDELIKKIKTSTDKNERYALMHQAEDLMFSDEEFLLCPIYYYVDIFLMNPKLKGGYSTPTGHKYLMYATLEQ